MDGDNIKIVYSRGRLEESARTFRKLGESCADMEVAGQLELMADVLEDCLAAGDRLQKPETRVMNSVEKMLAKRGIRVQNLYVLMRSDKPMEVIMEARTGRRGSASSREIALCLARTIGCDFEPDDGCRRMVNDTFHRFTFVQTPRYQVLTGKYLMAADETRVSGDNYSVCEHGKGRTALILADGMGSGYRARQESAVVVELLESSLEAGFDIRSAVGLVNAAIASGREDCHPVTVDMCVLDRYLGVARFVKLGAAASFIRRGSDVEIIRSTSLPLGVLERADYDSVVKKLQDGDEIILVSDGVVEALDGDDKEGQLRQMILDIKEKAPKAVAARLMEMVCTCNNRPLADDMSILVAGVFDTAINVY